MIVDWISKAFKMNKDNYETLFSIESIKEEINFNNEPRIDTINALINDKLFDTNDVDYTDQIKALIYSYNLNYKDSFDKLLKLEDYFNKISKVDPKEFESFEDLASKIMKKLPFYCSFFIVFFV